MNGKNNRVMPKISTNKWNEIQAIILFAVAVLILISLASFSFSDIGLFTSKPNVPIKNFAGIFGAYAGAALFFVMGLSSYVIPLLILSWAVARLFGVTPQKIYFKIFGTFFLILASSSIFSLLGRGDAAQSFRFSLGGIVGLVFSDFLVTYLGMGGAILVIGVLFLLSLLTATEFLLLPFLSNMFRNVKDVSSGIKDQIAKKSEPAIFTGRKPVIKVSTPQAPSGPARQVREEAVLSVKPEPVKNDKNIVIKVEKKEPSQPKGAEAKAQAAGAVKQTPSGPYKLPGFDLLDSPPPVESKKAKEDFEARARTLEDTLKEFDIEGKVIEINQGPVITRYELEPAPGVKVNRITALSDNIALTMKAESVRIVAPIPGKGTIGFEIPNADRAMVYMREVLDSKEYRQMKSKLKMALGKSIDGTPVVADLGKMPHLLIAGATGSGKTVCVNTIIASLLFNMTPDELKFIMVDPKRVELVPFNDMPYLLAPVVTDVKAVASTLAWVVNEMDERYKILAKAGVKNIDAYNESYGGKGDVEEDLPANMPYIIVVIDELADLMMVARDDVEHAITRLAQLARAVGIHLIIATQRPSVDVITGVIKANFPARISFKVASKVDSRTVLDTNGADALLGRGDMLFVEPGASDPVRAQGSLILDKEIDRLTAFIKTQREPNYIAEISEVQKKGKGGRTFDKDEVYEEAVKLILESKQASVSVLQRRLGVGYTRAARLIDMMEDEGIVGPYQGSKPRDLLVSLEEYQARSAGGSDGA